MKRFLSEQAANQEPTVGEIYPHALGANHDQEKTLSIRTHPWDPFLIPGRSYGFRLAQTRVSSFCIATDSGYFWESERTAARRFRYRSVDRPNQFKF